MNNHISDYQNYFNQMSQQQNTKENMNYNKPLFETKEKPNELYDPYDGFIRGNMFPSLYNQYKIPTPYNIEPMNEQAQLLTYVDMFDFAAHDLSLYLDVHPDNKSMVEKHNQYRVEAKNARKQYEDKFGPLNTLSNATNGFPWNFNNSPWPWEK